MTLVRPVLALPALMLLAAPSLGSCAHAASSTTATRSERAGACPSDLRLVLGACVAPEVAAKACGASAISSADGCTLRSPCEPGRARDLGTGECLARRDVRALATTLGILVADDQLVGCPEGEVLASGSDASGVMSLGCLPRPPGLRRLCPPGTILDASSTCASFVEGGAGGRGGRVDVVRWLHAVIGPDGGPGAPPLCDALARSPGALATPAAVDVSIAVSLAFPDNDVSQVLAGSAIATGRNGGAKDGPAEEELARVLLPMVEALRSVGGTASEAVVATTVRCRRASGRPTPK